MFAIAFDGFIQTSRYATLDEARQQWEKDVKNRLLYEYACSVYELDEKGGIKRIIGYEELKK